MRFRTIYICVEICIKSLSEFAYKAFYEVRYNIYHGITAYLLEKFNIVDFSMDFKTMSFNFAGATALHCYIEYLLICFECSFFSYVVIGWNNIILNY